MFCYKCGKELPNGTKFCVGCGAPQEPTPATPDMPEGTVEQAFQAAPQAASAFEQAPQAAPMYGQQPSYAMPAAVDANKKNKKITIILIIILALLVLGFGGFAVFYFLFL